MIPTVRIVDRPAFRIAGRSTYISGPDNDQFGRFWQQAQSGGLMQALERLSGFRPGPQTGAVTLGVSRVEQDPARRDFDYMIAVEVAANAETGDLETCTVLACRWAVFECRGPIPQSIVAAEIYAFTQWLPSSGFIHAMAPEMEVYPPGPEGTSAEACNEFWLPIQVSPH